MTEAITVTGRVKSAVNLKVALITLDFRSCVNVTMTPEMEQSCCQNKTV